MWIHWQFIMYILAIYIYIYIYTYIYIYIYIFRQALEEASLALRSDRELVVIAARQSLEAVK